MSDILVAATKRCVQIFEDVHPNIIVAVCIAEKIQSGETAVICPHADDARVIRTLMTRGMHFTQSRVSTSMTLYFLCINTKTNKPYSVVVPLTYTQILAVHDEELRNIFCNTDV